MDLLGQLWTFWRQPWTFGDSRGTLEAIEDLWKLLWAIVTILLVQYINNLCPVEMY